MDASRPIRHTSVEDAVVDLFTCVAARVFKVATLPSPRGQSQTFLPQGTVGSSFSEVVWHMRAAHGLQHPEDELYSSRQLSRLRWRRRRNAEKARGDPRPEQPPGAGAEAGKESRARCSLCETSFNSKSQLKHHLRGKKHKSLETLVRVHGCEVNQPQAGSALLCTSTPEKDAHVT